MSLRLVPDGVTTDVAAAAILKGMTAHLLIKSVYPVREGDTVLLHAGAGGVGLILTQSATSLGARVITCPTLRSPATQCRWFGLSDQAVTAAFHAHSRRVRLAHG